MYGAKFANPLLDHLLDIVFLGHVCFDETCLNLIVDLFQLLGNGFEARQIEIREDETSTAFRGERKGAAATNARSGTSDERNAVEDDALASRTTSLESPIRNNCTKRSTYPVMT